MAKLFGRVFTREDLLEHIGSVSQLAGVKKVRFADGCEEGVEALNIRTGSGLSFSVLASRGLGISSAEWQGKSLAWISPTGDVSPAFYEAHDAGFLRSFYGGLLVTCGLTNVGNDVEDNGKFYPIHGRISSIPASEVAYGGEWQGDDYVMWVHGKVREAVVFGENLLLTRRIVAKLGENRIWIEDTVENQGYEPTPHMILYHFNAGFPLLQEGTALVTPSQLVTPRDDRAEPGMGRYATMDAPMPSYQEQVFYHDVYTDDDGATVAALVNRTVEGGFGLYIKYFREELPVLVQWKQCGLGTYVMGIEPANCHVAGRVKERERGTLQVLEPGEVRKYRLEVGVLTSEAEIADMEARVARMRT